MQLSTSPKSIGGPQAVPLQLPGGVERILLVDDEESLAMTTGEWLESFGYQVIIASSGHEAVALFKAFQKKTEGTIDLIVMDWFLPGMSGTETIQYIASIAPETKFLLTTGLYIDSEQEIYKELQAVGLVGFLRKPYNAFRLAYTVRGALDHIGEN